MTEHFDYKSFAESMKSQAQEIVPNEFKEEDKKFMINILYQYTLIAGESLSEQEEFDLEQKEFLTQVLSEWMYHKSCDLIRSQIPQKYWEPILQKIAYVLFEIGKQGINKIEQERLLNAIEYHVLKTYKYAVKKLFDNNLISKEIANDALTHSNIDETAQIDFDFGTVEDIETNESFSIFSDKDFINYEFQDDGIMPINIEDCAEKESRQESTKCIKSIIYKGWVLVILTIVYNLLKHIHSIKAFVLTHADLIYPCCAIVITGVVCAGALLYYIVRIDIEKQLFRLEKVRAHLKHLADPDSEYENLGVDVLKLVTGTGLVPMIDPDQYNALLPELCRLRKTVAEDLGYIIPNIRIIDSTTLGNFEYEIYVRGNKVASGTVYPNKCRVLAEEWNSTGKAVPNDAIPSIDPVSQTKAYLINKEDAKWAESQSYSKTIAGCEIQQKITVDKPAEILVKHIQDICFKHVDEILTRTDTLKFMEIVRCRDKSLIEDLVPAIISVADLRKVLVNLITEKISIKDCSFIFEKLCDYARFSQDANTLSEQIRVALNRQICLKNTIDNVLYVATLSQDWEDLLLQNCKKTDLGTILALDSLKLQCLIQAVIAVLEKTARTRGIKPVILCSSKIRFPLYHILVKRIPTIVIMSHPEIVTDITVEHIAEITTQS